MAWTHGNLESIGYYRLNYEGILHSMTRNPSLFAWAAVRIGELKHVLHGQHGIDDAAALEECKRLLLQRAWGNSGI